MNKIRSMTVAAAVVMVCLSAAREADASITTPASDFLG
jgi:hypothetical protein